MNDGQQAHPSATAALYPEPHVVRRGAGMPLVFLHGNGVDHRLLLELDDAFDAPGRFERIYLDLPGFGCTPPLPGAGGLPELAGWLDRAVESLAGAAGFAVVGNSLGGLLARELAARRPEQVRGLALIAPVAEPDPARRRVPEQTILRADPELLASLASDDAADYSEMSVIQAQETWHAFERSVLPGIRAADGGAMDRLAARYYLHACPEDRLSSWPRPVLIVAGRQDHVVGYLDQFDLAQRYERATFAVLDGAGHNVQIEQPAAVRALLATWAGSCLTGA